MRVRILFSPRPRPHSSPRATTGNFRPAPLSIDAVRYFLAVLVAGCCASAPPAPAAPLVLPPIAGSPPSFAPRARSGGSVTGGCLASSPSSGEVVCIVGPRAHGVHRYLARLPALDATSDSRTVDLEELLDDDDTLAYVAQIDFRSEGFEPFADPPLKLDVGGDAFIFNFHIALEPRKRRFGVRRRQ